jgi:alpha-beta hydrolase superfamily lysophospholipase
MKKKPNRILRRSLRIGFLLIFFIFALLNWVAYNHAWQFTHSNASMQGEAQLAQAEKVAKASFWDKAGYFFWGVSIPKSQNSTTPDYAYETLWFVSGKDSMEAWWLESEEDETKGVVTLWHGYGASKSQLLYNAAWWLKQGYDCLMVDFCGHGGSNGNRVTIGYAEAESVKLVNDWVKKKYPEQPSYLFGSSMGSVAILKAAQDYDLGATGLILECPFATLRHAIVKRFELVGAPTFLMPDLLLFWGGVQNGYWAYGHSCVKYAKKVTTPTLILYGEKDPKVGREEVELVYKSLASKKKDLVTFPCAEHNYMLPNCPKLWPEAVLKFMEK